MVAQISCSKKVAQEKYVSQRNRENKKHKART